MVLVHEHCKGLGIDVYTPLSKCIQKPVMTKLGVPFVKAFDLRGNAIIDRGVLA